MGKKSKSKPTQNKTSFIAADFFIPELPSSSGSVKDPVIHTGDVLEGDQVLGPSEPTPWSFELPAAPAELSAPIQTGISTIHLLLQ